MSQEVRQMAKVSGTAEHSVSQQVAVGRFLFLMAQSNSKTIRKDRKIME